MSNVGIQGLPLSTPFSLPLVGRVCRDIEMDSLSSCYIVDWCHSNLDHSDLNACSCM